MTEVDRFTIYVLTSMPAAVAALEFIQLLWVALVMLLVPEMFDEASLAHELEAL